MKELSVFIDESGDFGAYEPHSPLYLLTLVFHDQASDITPNLLRLQDTLKQRNLPDYTVHAGPLIRRDNEYREMDMEERRKIFNNLFYFLRTVDISYKTITIDKKHLIEDIDLIIRISKGLSLFLNSQIEYFMQYDRIVVYYDYGQRELTKILISMFNAVLNNVEFKKAVPAKHKLFQAADMLCTLELLSEKARRKLLSKSELAFFSSERDLHKSYLRAIYKKRFNEM
jgi:hypothetical protein